VQIVPPGPVTRRAIGRPVPFRALGLGPPLGHWVEPLQGPLLGLPLAVAQVPQRVLPLGPRLVVLGERSLVEL
jgi:hypothetical protein